MRLADKLSPKTKSRLWVRIQDAANLGLWLLKAETLPPSGATV